MYTEKNNTNSRTWKTFFLIEGNRHRENIIQEICTSVKKQNMNSNELFSCPIKKYYLKTYTSIGTFINHNLAMGCD